MVAASFSFPLFPAPLTGGGTTPYNETSTATVCCCHAAITTATQNQNCDNVECCTIRPFNRHGLPVCDSHTAALFRCAICDQLAQRIVPTKLSLPSPFSIYLFHTIQTARYGSITVQKPTNRLVSTSAKPNLLVPRRSSGR